MSTEVPPDEPGYYSEGQYAATARALTEIVVPALTSVSDILREKDFYDGRFTTSIKQQLMKQVANLTIKPTGQPTSSLTFEYDPQKGGSKIKEVIKSPQVTTIESNTRLIVKSADARKTRHVTEENLTKEILEKFVFDFVEAVVQSNKEQSKKAAPAKIVGDKSAPALTSRQRGSLFDAVEAIMKTMERDPDRPITFSQILASGRTAQEVYNLDAIADKKRYYWQTDLTHAATDGVRKSVRTSAKRKTAVRRLQKELKTVPTTAILKAAYPAIVIDDAACELLDADLKNLSL